MRPRRYLTQRQKNKILIRQRDNCNVCGKPLISGLYEWDHIQDRQFDGDDELDNWQAICTKPCHQEKTARAAGDKSRANEVRLGKMSKWRRPMQKRDFMDTPEYRIEQAARDVRTSISNIVNLAKVYPDIVRLETAYLSNAADDLSELVGKLGEREAAE